MPTFHSEPFDSTRAPIPAGTYTVDSDRSHLGFRAKAFGLMWVRGRIPVSSGTIEVADNRLTGHGLLAADRIATGVGPRDWHLRSSHYLHTAEHPTIAVAILGADLTAEQAGCKVVVRDTPAPVQLDLQSVEVVDGGLRITAATTFDRTVYPMLPPIAGVSRRVHLDVSVVAHRTDLN